MGMVTCIQVVQRVSLIFVRLVHPCTSRVIYPWTLAHKNQRTLSELSGKRAFPWWQQCSNRVTWYHMFF